MSILPAFYAVFAVLCSNGPPFDTFLSTTNDVYMHSKIGRVGGGGPDLHLVYTVSNCTPIASGAKPWLIAS